MATVEIKKCTRDLVDSLLKMNTNNRAVNKRSVNGLAKEMMAGKFMLTPNGVGIDTNGVLVDGQHRLEAMRMAGYPPIEFILVKGLDPESRLCVDIHRKRSMRDMLHFAFDCRVSRTAPAICNSIISNRSNWSGGITNPTPNDIIEIMEEHQIEIEKVVACPRNKSFFAATSLAGFVVAAKETSLLEVVLEFMQSVEDGELHTAKMPAYHLRNFINTSKGSSGGGTASKERFLKTYKATMAYIQGKEMGVLRLP